MSDLEKVRNLGDDTNESWDSEDESIEIVVGDSFLGSKPIKQAVFKRQQAQNFPEKNPNTASKQAAVTYNQHQLLEPSSSTASNENLSDENSLEHDRERILQLIQNPTAFPVFVELDFQMLGSQNKTQTLLDLSDQSPALKPNDNTWASMQQFYTKTNPDGVTNYFKIFIVEGSEMHSSKTHSVSNRKFSLHIYQNKGVNKGMSIVFPVEELANLIAQLYKINLLAAAKLVISNLMHFKNEVELLMKTDVRKAFALQAKLKKQISLSLEHIIPPVFSEEDESIEKFENKRCALVKERICMLQKLNEIHEKEIGELEMAILRNKSKLSRNDDNVS